MKTCLGMILLGAFASSVPAQQDRPQSDRAQQHSVAAGDVVTVTGDDLRRSGASSLGEALLGKVPGLTWQLSSGVFGALPAMQLRGRASVTSRVNPLVLVDGVPVSVNLVSGRDFSGSSTSNMDARWTNITDFLLADIDRVTVIRGAAAVAEYGPRASAGAVVIETRRPKSGVNIAIAQRFGVASIGESLPARRFTQAEAAQNRGSPFSPRTTPAERSVSWDACGGFCDHEDDLFGGSRLLNQTTARVEGGGDNTTGSVSLVSRRGALPVRGTSDDFLGGRLAGHHDGGRLQLRASQVIQRSKGNYPLQQGGQFVQGLPAGTLLLPSWVNPRGFLADSSFAVFNALYLAENVRSPRQVTQYITQGSVDYTLRRGRGVDLSAHVRGGVHKLAQDDQVLQRGTIIAQQSDLFRSGDLEDQFVDGWLSAASRGRVGTASLAAGYTGQRNEREGNQEFVTPGGSARNFFRERQSMRGFWGTGRWQAPGDRADLAFTARRESPNPSGTTADPAHSLVGAAAVRPARGDWGSVTLRVGASALDLVDDVSLAFLVFGIPSPRESRCDVDAGVIAELRGIRTTFAINVFESRARDALIVPGLTAPPGTSPDVLRGEIRNRGFDARLTVQMVRAGSFSWDLSALAGRTRADFMDDDFFPVVGQFVLPAMQRRQLPGGSLTAVTDVQGTVIGDLAPDLVFSQQNALAWNGWRLTTQLDGEWGGDLGNFSQRARDTYALSDAPDGGSARLALAAAGGGGYLQSGSFALLREVVLSRTLGRARGLLPDGTRIELAGRNLLLMSDLEGYDPSARAFGGTTERGLALNPYPRMRSVALSLVVGL